MITFKAILFIFASFIFLFSLVKAVLSGVNAICSSINKNPQEISVTLEMWLASLSFAYIMAYLFIW